MFGWLFHLFMFYVPGMFFFFFSLDFFVLVAAEFNHWIANFSTSPKALAALEALGLAREFEGLGGRARSRSKGLRLVSFKGFFG